MANESSLPWYRQCVKRLVRAAGICAFLGVFSLPLLFQGCSGSNQAIDSGGTNAPIAAPAPPIEVPSILRFVGPAQLKIDISAISAGASPDVSKGAVLLGIIETGPLYANIFTTEFGATISGIDELQISTYLIDPATGDYQRDPVTGALIPRTSFDNDGNAFTFTTATGMLAGTHHVKIDFADFDYDNDGTKEGCSGSAAALPVCARMWVDDAGGHFVPILAGIFGAYPHLNDPNVPDTIGAGRFKLHADPLTLQEGAHPTMGATIQYSYGPKPNVADSKQVKYEFWFAPPTGDTSGTGIATDVFGQLLLSQEGPDATPFKGINMSQYMPLTPTPPEKMKYLGQFVDGLPAGQSYWAGRLFVSSPAQGIIDSTSPDLCATLPDGNEVVDRTPCEHVGPNGVNILTDGIPFFDFLDASSFAVGTPLAFPADFPLQPPVCGNGVIESGEACEGTNFNGATCLTLGLPDGTLTCVNCSIDTTLCCLAANAFCDPNNDQCCGGFHCPTFGNAFKCTANP